MAWTVTGSMVVSGGSAGLLLNDGRVLAVVGGTADAELYDPVLGSWTQTTQVANHLGGILTLLPGGRVLVVGQNSSSNPAAEIFNPTTNSWAPAAPPPNDHSGGTASLVGGKVLVVGTSRSGTGTSDIYDPATNSWSAAGNLNVPRYLHTATVLANGKVLVAGGCSSVVGGVLSSLELFDPGTGGWTRVGNLSEARMSQTATLLPSGQVLFSGGLNAAQVATASTELVDSLNLQAVPTSVPGAPGAGYGNIGDRVVTLNWSAPGDDGGAPITGYYLATFVGGVLQSLVLVPAGGSFPQHVVAGLTDGTAYTFSVAAVNSVGTGPPASFPGSYTPVAGYPDAPTNVVAVGLDASAQVSWTVPSGNGNAITAYSISSSPDGGFQSCPASPCTLLHLANGTSYTFTVTANNSMGSGPPSAPSNAVAPANTNGFPDAPTNVIAVGLPSGSASVSWTAPNDNGSPITGYTMTWTSFSSPSTGTQSCAGSPCTVTGLTNGTFYSFTVTATNSKGTGLASIASSAAPGSVPGIPTNVSATAGNAQATLTWTAPTSDGGPINGYWVTWSDNNQYCSGSPCTVTGLTNWTSYTFTVHAANSVGQGPESASSNPVTPASVPGALTHALPALSNGAYGGFVTATYIENIGTGPATVYIYYFDGAGASVGAGDTIVNLPPGATWTVRQDNGNSFAHGAAGSGIVVSTQPVAAFVNEFASASTADASSYSGALLPSAAGARLYAPAIANNAYGGYTTGIGLMNMGHSPTDVTITYRNLAGTAVRTQTLAGVPAHAYQALYSGDPVLGLPSGFTGSATLTSSMSDITAVVNETGPGNQFSSYEAVTAGSAVLFAPAALKDAYGGYNTGVGIQNVTATAGTVTINYYDASGAAITHNFPIAANGYLGVYQGTDIPIAGAYTAKITSDVAIAAIVNEVAPSSTSSKQSTAYNTFPSGTGTTHLPLVENAGSDGWSTGEGIMNTGSTVTTVNVTYYDTTTGSALGSQQTLSLQPNAFWGLYQPAGSLPSGDRASAVVTASSGGQVAVICNESTSTTFMSYGGQ